MKLSDFFSLGTALCATLAMTSLALAADTLDRTHAPAAGPLPSVTFPTATVEPLPNGLRVFLLPTDKQPMVRFRLLVKAHSGWELGQPGLAALTAALLNKGTERLSATEFAQATDFLGISVEASAGDDALTVSAVALSRDSRKTLEFLRDAVLHPAFREAEIDKEKTRLLAQLTQAKMDPDELATKLRNRLVFGADHDYARFATPESVKAITRESIAQFHAQQFRSSDITLTVVGDFQTPEMLEEIKAAFGKEAFPPTPKPCNIMQQGAEPRPDAQAAATPQSTPGKLTPEQMARIKEFTKNWKPRSGAHGISVPVPMDRPVRVLGVHVINRPGSVQTNLVVAAPGIARDNPDARELSVVNALLGGGMSGRLFANLREKHGYTYGAYSGFAQRRRGGAFAATAEVRNEVTGAAAAEILAELRRIHGEPIPEEELALSRNLLVGNFLMSVENDQRTAERLQEIDLYGLPPDYYTAYAAKLTALDATRASALARKYISPENLVIIAVGEAKEIAPQLEKFGPVTVYDTDLKAVETAPKAPVKAAK